MLLSTRWLSLLSVHAVFHTPRSVVSQDGNSTGRVAAGRCGSWIHSEHECNRVVTRSFMPVRSRSMRLNGFLHLLPVLWSR
eukprot:COSAG02_NODE_46458_length_348_cov_1.875502_1_plen_80_part_10